VRKNNMKYFLWFSLALSLSLLIFIFNDDKPEYRTVGISKGLVEIPCAKPEASARCTAPNPKEIAFYVKALDHAFGRPEIDKSYDTEVLLGLFVSGDELKTIHEHGTELGNYLIGGRDSTVRIYYFPGSELAYKLKWYGHWGKYAPVSSDVDGYDKYDDITCPKVDLLVSKKVAEAKMNTCAVIRRALYVPKASPDVLIDCHQYLEPDGVLSLRGCRIHSSLAMGGRVEYSIEGKNFVNGRWVALNKAIVNYLNGMLTSIEGE